MRNTLGCCAHIRLLLDIYVSGEIPNPGTDSTNDGLELLRGCRAIEIVGDRMMTTDIGSAWVKALCQVPIPRVAYLDQTGKEIK